MLGGNYTMSDTSLGRSCMIRTTRRDCTHG